MKVYSRTRQVAILVTGTVALTLLLGSMAVSALAAPAQQNLNVTVTNPSLAVTQSGAWTVAATQSGTWTVGLASNTSVKSGDETVLLDSFVGEVEGGGAFTEAADAATVGYGTVRVITNCFAGADCANITVRVYTITAGARSYLLEQFTMQSFVATTRVYDVPGTSMAVQLLNNNAGSITNVGVAIFGRAN